MKLWACCDSLGADTRPQRRRPRTEGDNAAAHDRWFIGALGEPKSPLQQHVAPPCHRACRNTKSRCRTSDCAAETKMCAVIVLGDDRRIVTFGPWEWRDRPGGNQKTFRVEEINNVTHRSSHTHRSSGEIQSCRDQLADMCGMPTSLGIAIESNDQLNANTTICLNVGWHRDSRRNILHHRGISGHLDIAISGWVEFLAVAVGGGWNRHLLLTIAALPGTGSRAFGAP
jgi:hypothetical protein